MVREKKSKVKKENLIFMLLVILLVSIIMCVSSFGIATWARYRTATGGNVTAQIAKWSFKVNKQSEEFAQINLIDTISFEHVEKTTIAPGTYGSFNLEIDGSGSEVSLDYYIDIDVLQKATNMKFYSDASHSASKELQIVNNKIQLENEILLTDDSMAKTEIIYWDWAYRTNTYPSQEVINKYLAEQPIDGLQALVNEYNADGTTDSRKAEIALKINDLIDTKEAGKDVLLPIKVVGIQKNVNGLESKGITITSDTNKTYNEGDELTFALEFTESVYADENKSKITSENAPVIILDFEEIETANNPIAKVASIMNSHIMLAETARRQATFVSAERNKLNYKYEIKKGDTGTVKIASISGDVYGISKNKIELSSSNVPNILNNAINSNAGIEKFNLADVVEIGDYVNYDPGDYSVDDEGRECAREVTGWRVLSKDEETGVVELISEEPVFSAEYNYYGMDNRYKKRIALFGKGNGAESSRGLKLNDILKYSNYNPSSYTNYSGIRFSDSKVYSSGDFLPTNSTDYLPNTISGGKQITGTTSVRASTTYKVTVRQSAFRTDATSMEQSFVGELNKKMYELIFKNPKDVENNMAAYWLETSCINAGTNYASYGVFQVKSGGINTEFGYSSDTAYHSMNDAQVRPVVKLKANIQTTGKNHDNVWELYFDE